MRSIFLGLFAAVLILQTSVAVEKGQVSTVSESVLLGKQWNCDWKSVGFPGTLFGKYQFTIENITENNFSGKFENSFCPKVLAFEGVIEGDELSWKIGRISGICVKLIVNVKLAENEEGESVLRGSYKGQYSRQPDSGNIMCK